MSFDQRRCTFYAFAIGWLSVAAYEFWPGVLIGVLISLGSFAYAALMGRV